jgi:hypothetical protein
MVLGEQMTITGRVLAIIREHGDWLTVEDIYAIYQFMLEHGFEPDEMGDNDLRYTTEQIRKKNGRYIWEYFYNVPDERRV